MSKSSPSTSRAALQRSRAASAFILVGIALLPRAAEPGSEGKIGVPALKAPLRAVPVRDAADQPFRRAPMPESPRSIAIPLTTNLHLAFDTALLRTHTAWEGSGLNLFGPPYHGGKEPFICTPEGTALWTMPQESPWSAGASAARPGSVAGADARFLGLRLGQEGTTLLYEVAVGEGKVVHVRERARAAKIGVRHGIVRRIDIGPCALDLWFLAHAEMGRVGQLGAAAPARAGLIEREQDSLFVVLSGPASVTLTTAERMADDWREVITEAGTEQEWERVRLQGSEARVYARIPAHETELSLELTSLVCAGTQEADQLIGEVAGMIGPAKDHPEESLRAGPRPFILTNATGKASVTGDRHFRIEAFPLPKEANLMVTGMDFLPNGDLALCTWTGEVWIVEGATGPVGQARYRRFARGLNEPLGLKVAGASMFIVQKCELTRLTDTDRDGEADLFENVCDQWGYTGNYHAFAFGPVIDKRGNLFAAICGQRGRWDMTFLGWAVKIDPAGQRAEPFCSGLRAPNGLAFFGPEQDLFATDNEGNWIGACKLNHLQAGRFYGYPSATPAPREDWGRQKEFHQPAVWIPKRLAPSASGMAVVESDSFGPFKGQMLVGDFQNALVLRVMLERVGGEWQGAVWPFAKGLASGVNRLAFGPDGKLYAGGLKNKAWPSLGPREFSLDRVSFTGEIPFEIGEVHATSEGFRLKFTQVVDRRSAEDVESYAVLQFRYRHHAAYGSPEFDHENRPNRATTIEVKSARLTADGLVVDLTLAGLKTGFVTQVRSDVLSAHSEPLRQDGFFYTLNRIPESRGKGAPGD